MILVKDLRAKIAATIKGAEASNLLVKDVSLHQYEDVLAKINTKFLTTRKYSDSIWWWTVYKDTNSYSIHFQKGNAFEALDDLLPSDKNYWFVASEENGKYWLYESKIESIQWLIANMHAFEYYIIDKKHEWILCENHHDMLIGVGHELINKLRAFELKNSYYAEVEAAYELAYQGIVLSLRNQHKERTISPGEGIKILRPDGGTIVSSVKAIVFESGDVLLNAGVSKEDFPKGSVVLITA